LHPNDIQNYPPDTNVLFDYNRKNTIEEAYRTQCAKNKFYIDLEQYVV